MTYILMSYITVFLVLMLSLTWAFCRFRNLKKRLMQK